jgi:hypothetical protein
LLIWIAIVLNLSAFDEQGIIWTHVKPVHGLAQKALFAAWFGWCAIVGTVLFQQAENWARKKGTAAARAG